MKRAVRRLRGRARRALPFLHWARELRDPRVVRADAVAGVTVALLLVPQCMAYAQLAGLPVHYGLYASFLPVIVGGLFGSSRQLSTGPVAIVSLLTASALQPLAASDPQGYLAYAVMLALMVGVFEIALGVLRLGVLADFLSNPVVTGFTNAAALVIATSQLDVLFGVNVESAEHYYETVWRTLTAAATHAHLPTLAMSGLAFAIIVGVRRLSSRLPSVLIAVASTTLLAWLIGFESQGGAVVGDVPAGLPGLSWPTFDVGVASELMTAAVAIALVGFLEAISIAKAMALRTGQRLDVNQELVAQGLANVSASLSQGYPVSGSFSRSALKLNTGAVTNFSSAVTGLVVAASLLWLTPLLAHLPLATLGVVIIMAVGGLIKIEPLRAAWRVQRHDMVVGVVTFALTLLWAPHLDRGILVGVALALGLYVFRNLRPRVEVLSGHPDGMVWDPRLITVMRLDGPLSFANSGYFERHIMEQAASSRQLRFVVIDASSINDIDATGEQMLQELARHLRARKVDLLMARVRQPLMDAFRTTGFVGVLGQDHFFGSPTAAIGFAQSRVEAD